MKISIGGKDEKKGKLEYRAALRIPKTKKGEKPNAGGKGTYITPKK